MGLFKKIFRPVAKVLDKVIPNEIKPALPYLAALAPVFAPAGMQGLIGSTMGRRALTSGLLNIGAQLSQEGSEGDINLLSAGLGALTGAMTAPGAAETFRGAQSANVLQDANVKRTALQKATDFGLEGLAKGSDIFAAGMADPFSKAGLKAATLPAATATGDLMLAEARQLEKQAAIDAALSEAAALGDDANRALALSTAMEAYGFFTDEEIEDTIASAGYKAGGRVGFKNAGLAGLLGGAKEKESKYITKKSDTSETDTINRIYEEQGSDGLSAYLDRNPDLKDKYVIVADGMSGELTIMPNKLHPDNMDMENIIMIKGDDGNVIDMSSMFEEKKAKGGRIGVEEGGLMNLGGKEMDLRKGGFVPIGKKERADDVPARLSKNEFVMTADAVRAAGGGSVNKGAKRMYNLMNTLEARA